MSFIYKELPLFNSNFKSNGKKLLDNLTTTENFDKVKYKNEKELKDTFRYSFKNTDLMKSSIDLYQKQIQEQINKKTEKCIIDFLMKNVTDEIVIYDNIMYDSIISYLGVFQYYKHIIISNPNLCKLRTYGLNLNDDKFIFHDFDDILLVNNLSHIDLKYNKFDDIKQNVLTYDIKIHLKGDPDCILFRKYKNKKMSYLHNSKSRKYEENCFA